MRDRGWRLKQERRIKRKVKKYWNCYSQSPRVVGIVAHTHHPCSCAICHRGRKYAKGKDALTMQERQNSGKILDEISLDIA